MKAIIFSIFILYTIPLVAQTKANNFDIRFGVGRVTLGLGEAGPDGVRTVGWEGEINYKINKYLSSAVSVNYGIATKNHLNSFWYPRASFNQENVNLFISPFTNLKTNNFRVGPGLSLINTSYTNRLFARYEDGELVETEFSDIKKSKLGYNLVLEDTYSLTNKLLVGLKVFFQTNFSGEGSSGILFKAGFKL